MADADVDGQLIRTLLLIFLILAFSRPSVKSHLPLLGTYSKNSTVILIDNSYSMDVSDEFGNRLSQAKSNNIFTKSIHWMKPLKH
jgi:hypothetical protein